ncbi:CBS domain-containing protein [Kibdelosporangium lantanae]
MKASEIMSRPVSRVRPEEDLRDAAVLMADRGFAALPVVDEDGQVVGMLSESDVLRHAADMSDRAVAQAMTTSVVVVAPDTELAEVATRMLTDRLRSVPVVDRGALVGIIGRRDLLTALIQDDAAIAARVRQSLVDYAGRRRPWQVEVDHGMVRIVGEFADEAERGMVTALARTVAGVVGVDLEQPS